jgi:hypothetical protein
MFNKNVPAPLKVGDQVVVYGPVISAYKAKIESIIYDRATDRVEIALNWGEYGKSKVYGHDRGTVWNTLTNVN